ncbi:MAG: RecQ family ATP-dependent DNA helicase [Candidatus Kapabacteria bacterium]|nr:RecQ family ATP-dependent DNA helicase [Candidatus Kapabacteria bacterium]
MQDREHKALKHYFGYDSFRDGQEETIRSVLEGRDTLVVMPTGGGKSLCYQLPAALFSGTAIVISPLIALMKDQTDALEKTEIPATFINSSLPRFEIQQRLKDTADGKYRLLYIAPERLDNQKFIDVLPQLKPSFLAVDEAHCISEWGHDFRPAYLHIQKIREILPYLPIIALTATATPDVQDDIVKSLGMRDPQCFLRGFDRPNLIYVCELSKDKAERIIDYRKKCEAGSTIVYCGSRRRVEEIGGKLREYSKDVLVYHAGMPPQLRKSIQEEFINSDNKIIVATNAFGMGIDKANVRHVFHCDLPSTIEAYYQEAGRAGRDGKPAHCVMLYFPDDRQLQDFFIRCTYPPLDEIETVYNTLFDLNSTARGFRSHEPILLSDAQIGNIADVPAIAVSSVVNLLQRNDLLRRGSTQGRGKIQFTTSRERLIEYFQSTTPERSAVLESLLRSVSPEAFKQEQEIDINDLMRKYDLTAEEIKVSMHSFEMGRLLRYIPPGTSKAITLTGERRDFKTLPIDFEAFAKRREHAVLKLDLVQRYAETDECKRNYILSYFRDDSMTKKCGRCSSCSPVKDLPRRMKVRPRKQLTARQKYLSNLLLQACAELNGNFGRSLIIDFLKGYTSKAIQDNTLFLGSTFAAAKDFSVTDIQAASDRAMLEKDISLSPDLHPKIILTNQGLNKIKNRPKAIVSKNHRLSQNLDPDLMKRLKAVRADIAQREGIVPRGVLSDIALGKIIKTRPKDISQMKAIPGIGPVFLNRFAEQFIAEINNSEEKISLFASKLNKPPELPEEVAATIKFVNKGLPLDYIAKKRKLKPADIARHIQAAIDKGIAVKHEQFFHKSIYDSVTRILKKTPTARLSEIRAKLIANVDYPTLRITVACARKVLGIRQI